MSIQEGFGVEVEAPDRSSGNPVLDGPGLYRISNKPNENRGTVVLLSDQTVTAYRHYIKTPYVPGRKGTRKDVLIREARMTCANSRSKDMQPRECKLCEAMLRHDDKIKRKFTSNMSLIDQRVITTKRGTLHDMKRVLELDYAYHMIFKEKKDAAQDGRLAPKQYSVMRPTGDATQSRVFGDSWTDLRSLIQSGELLRFFWESKAIPGIMKAAQAAGEQITWQQAVEQLIAPYPTTVFDNYAPDLAEVFIQIALGRDYSAEQAQQGMTQQQMGTAPPMPGGALPPGMVPTQPPGGLQPPPGVAPAYQQVPPGAVAAPPPAPPAQQPMAAAAPPMAPPMTADPMQAQAQAPQAPPVQPMAPASPMAPPAPQAAPQAPQAAPQAPQAALQQPAIDQYSFAQGAPPMQPAQGWSPQFPGQPAPQPLAAPPTAPQAPQAVAPPPPVAPQAPMAPPAPPAAAPGAPQIPTGINPGF